MNLEVRVLGPLSVLVGGDPVELGGPKPRHLLAALVAQRNRRVGLDSLTDLLWPDARPSDPRRNLQVQVSSLRGALAPHGAALENLAGGYRLVLPDGALDVDLVEREARLAADAAAAGQPALVVEHAEAALAQWRGEAYEDCRCPAVADQVEYLGTLRLRLEVARARAELDRGRHRAVLPGLQALASRNPEHEEVLGLLMLALHRSGRQEEALEAYRDWSARRVDRLGLDPGAGLRDLHQRILTDDPSLRVEDAELEERRHLPAPRTSFVGRAEDLADLLALMRPTPGEPGRRLVTVLGPGGVGKTRLALQAAHDLADSFDGGVWFVPLTEAGDPTSAGTVVAATLGVPDTGPGTAVERVADHLGRRRVLLVLDNLEHLPDLGPAIGSLLTSCPGTAVLATSRTPLDVYGETPFVLRPLDLDTEAVPLFEQRARAGDRFFRVADDSGRDTVRRLCRGVDCLPLGIELVAARVRDHRLEELAEGLAGVLDLASSGPRDLPQRQQGLRAAVQWSYDLLSEPARPALAGLAVFAGGFTGPAAEAVAGADAATVKELRDAHLVVPEPGGRHGMLETIRAFSAERLHAAGRADELGRAHAEWYLGWVRQARSGLRTERRAEWLRLLAAEDDNLRAALSWLLGRTPEDAVRLAAPLGYYWYLRGAVTEGIDWLQRCLPHARGTEETDPRLMAEAWHGLAILLGERGESEAALEACGRSTALFHRAGDEAGLARSLNSQGGIARDLARPEEAAPLLEESLRLRRRLRDPSLPTGIALANLALTALDREDPAAARDWARQCLDQVAGPEDRASVVLTLADIALAEGEVREARALLPGAVETLLAAGVQFRLIESLDVLAGLAAAEGDAELAATLVAAADGALEEDQATLVPADAVLRSRRLRGVVDSLHPDRLTSVRDRGRALDVADAVALAVDRLGLG